MRLVKKVSLFPPILLFLLTSFVYLHNLSGSVFGGDVGDFVTAAKVMGVPHPAGYPLITILGFFLTRINFFTPAFMVGLISVFSSSIGVVLFYFFSLELTKNKLIAIISALILAFNYLFWFYSEIAEVFALNNFFVIILMFIAFLYYKYRKVKYLYLLALLAGVSLTNNYIISLIFPSLGLLVFSNYKQLLKKPKIILKCFILTLLGFSLYLYVPFSSFFNPPVNWGNVKDLGSFLDVLLRRHYGTFSVGSTPVLVLFQKILIQKDYFFTIFYQLSPPVIFFCILGLVSLIRKSKLLLMVILLGFLLAGPFFVFLIGLPLSEAFHIGIYERFYTMSSVILLLFFPLGLNLFVQFLNRILKKKIYEKLFIGIFLIIPLLLFKANFNKTDLHNVWIGDNMAYDLLTPLPKNSFFMPIGDSEIFNTWYVRYALNVRQDVTLLNAVGNTSLKQETDMYLKKHPGESKNPDLIARTFEQLAVNRPVFSAAQIQVLKGKKLLWIPFGLGYRLLKSENEIPTKEEFLKTQEEVWGKFRNKSFDNPNLSENSLTISEIPEIYSNALIAHGAFINRQYKDGGQAVKFYKKAISLDKNNRKSYLALAAYYTSLNECGKVQENLMKAINIYPLDGISYYLLYYNYNFCFKDKTSAQAVIAKYNKLFKGDFFKDLKEYTDSQPK